MCFAYLIYNIIKDPRRRRWASSRNLGTQWSTSPKDRWAPFVYLETSYCHCIFN